MTRGRGTISWAIITCNNCGFGIRSEEPNPSDFLKKYAKRLGWKLDKSAFNAQDLCPACAAKQEQEAKDND